VKRLMIAVLVLMLVATPVFAGNVHLKGGKNAVPSFNDLSLALNATGALAGLGYGDVFVNLAAAANVTSTCTNPAGATQPPGQNPAPITVSGGEAIPASELKNGNTPFDVTTNPPPSTIAGAPDCPNPQWTEAITDLAFTSATITVEQPVGTVVFTLVCTFNPPTADGKVPAGTVSCS
jgi:hypothetical protein